MATCYKWQLVPSQNQCRVRRKPCLFARGHFSCCFSGVFLCYCRPEPALGRPRIRIRPYCLPELAPGRPRIRIRPYCVLSIVYCVSVLCRAELSFYWTDVHKSVWDDDKRWIDLSLLRVQRLLALVDTADWKSVHLYIANNISFLWLLWRNTWEVMQISLIVRHGEIHEKLCRYPLLWDKIYHRKLIPLYEFYCGMSGWRPNG